MEKLPDLTTIEPIQEEWRPVVGYEGLYSVSSLGRVRSEERVASLKGHPRLRSRRVPSRILRQTLRGPGKYGYLRVNLYRDGVMQAVNVHLLVAAAFLGEKPPGMWVLHGPMGRMSNQVTNLSYGTGSENAGRDKLRDGTLRFGENHHGAKLSLKQVAEIRASADSRTDLAARYGVSRSLIQAIQVRTAWKHAA